MLSQPPTDFLKFQNAYRDDPASPLNIIWVEDIGNANIVTFIMIKAEVIYQMHVKRENKKYKHGSEGQDALRDEFWILENFIVIYGVRNCLLQDVLREEQVPDDLEKY